MVIEAALGDTEPSRKRLHRHAGDPGLRQAVERALGPVVGGKPAAAFLSAVVLSAACPTIFCLQHRHSVMPRSPEVLLRKRLSWTQRRSRDRRLAGLLVPPHNTDAARQPVESSAFALVSRRASPAPGADATPLSRATHASAIDLVRSI